MKKKNSASIEMDDAFTPSEIIFRECDTTIRFSLDGESVRVQMFQGENLVKDTLKHSIRIPLYASTALAQLFTKTLNGQRLLK